MTKRDLVYLRASFALLLLLFLPLILHPGSIPGNFGDIYSYHYPLRHLVASTLQEGRLPLWNPYIFAGTPLAANPQAVLFYPPSLLHYFFPLASAFGLDAFFHLFMAGLGAYLLLRFWQIDSAGAWALSTAYALSPFLVCRISQGVPTHLAALSWVPWVWLAAERGSAAFLGIALALQVLSGHPQFAMINAAALGLWTVLRRPKNLPILISAGILGLFLGAIQIFPTLQFLRHSVRSHWSPEYSLGYSLQYSQLLTLLYPDFFSNPLRSDFKSYPSSFFEMLRLYIGVVPLMLGLFGLLWVKKKRGDRTPILWAIIAAGLFFSLGGNNPFYLPFQKLFRLDFLRVPARFSFLILWGLWMGAAAGWMKARHVLPKPARTWRAVLTLATVLDLAFWAVPWIYAQRPQDFLAPNTELLRFLRNSPLRIATSPDVLAPNKSMLYRIPDATGYEAFYLAEIAFYTSRSENAPSADGSKTYILNWRTPEMSRLGVRYYISPAPMEGASPVLQRKSLYVYENPKALPFVQGADSWNVLNPEHWTASGAAPTHLLFSQAPYPGWTVWINGNRSKTKIQDDFFPGVDIEDKDWNLHFRFVPEVWFMSAWITLAAILLLGMLSLRWMDA